MSSREGKLGQEEGNFDWSTMPSIEDRTIEELEKILKSQRIDAQSQNSPSDKQKKTIEWLESAIETKKSEKS